jgi:tetratricopeptide (TPR) repeat protein
VLAWLLTGLLALPVALTVGRFSLIRWDRFQAERAASAALAGPSPVPAAYGVLGGIRLEQGRLAEAVPLLQKAAALEMAGHQGTRDTLSLAKALIGLGRLDEAAAALKQAEALTDKAPQGEQARTYFSAGEFWRQMGRKPEALADLRRAVALQPDDWVDLGPGGREKSAGLSGYYQKMLAAAEQDR